MGEEVQGVDGIEVKLHSKIINHKELEKVRDFDPDTSHIDRMILREVLSGKQ